MMNEELLKRIEVAKASGETYLNLSQEHLTFLPIELLQLANLTLLDLRGNQLTSLPPEIGQLTNLTWLHLSSNYFTILPPELLQLRNLTWLYFSDNQLTVLPPEIAQLTKLKRLYLSGNQLTSLPSEIGQLTNLTVIDLSDNQLTTLPPEIGRLTNLTAVYLSGNPLTALPSEIRTKGSAVICQYLANLQTGEQPLNEVKVLLVGDGAAGKTSLVKQLLGDAFDKDEDTTHGISIRGWDVEAGGQPIKVNIWDFGGQEIMHATHQFFLSKRSLYVLVLDGRKDERPEYWLQHIESFGGNSPVLVVLNKQDSNPAFDINRPFLLQKYPGIRRFFRTSCKTGGGIAHFKEALIEELGKVPMIGIRWPKRWFAVKQRIEQMRRPYISREEYGELCNEAQITDEKSRETLVDFLHDLGVAVHFKDFVLKTMHVLDPVWVTNAVYKIVNAEEMRDKNGVLHADCLDSILEQRDTEKHCYPAQTRIYLLELMKKFELCYELDRESVLIPQLVPVPEPSFTFDYSGSLGFALHYPDFLPPSVFPRFMVKVHKDIEDDYRWRTGMMLEDKQNGVRAVIKADIEARRINIWVNGEHRRDYLHYLRYTLADINSSFEKLSVSERVPMPDEPQRTADYQTLLNYAKEDIRHYIPDGTGKKYSVHELLGLVQPKSKDELIELIRKVSVHLDEKESGTEVAASLFELKPNIIGIGFNLNELFARILAWAKQRQQQSRR